jgi:uncharacterized membrane protein
VAEQRTESADWSRFRQASSTESADWGRFRQASSAARLDQPREPGRIKVPRFDPEAFGRWSEGFARYMGTPKFIVYMTVVILLWFGWNTLAPQGWRFDPYTFTFLTLILSLQASYAAPLILLAQNRQTDRDRLTMEEDRRRASMQKADTEYLSREIAALRIALGEVATRDFLRSELTRLADELGETMLSDGRKDAARRRQRAERQGSRASGGRRAGQDQAKARRADRDGADEPDEPDEPDDESNSDAPHGSPEFRST